MLSPVPVWLQETPQVFSTATPHVTESVLMLQLRSQNYAPRRRCQCLYFYASKASKLRACALMLQLRSQNCAPQACRYLYFCTRKASKASTWDGLPIVNNVARLEKKIVYEAFRY